MKRWACRWTPTRKQFDALTGRHAAKAHPDRAGGSAAKMAALNVAYGVLGDASKRERYDRTGDDSERSPHAQAEMELLVLFASLFDREEEPPDDIIASARGAVAASISAGGAKRVQVQRRLLRAERLIARIRGPATFTHLAKQKTKDLRRQLSAIDEELNVRARMLELLKLYADIEAHSASQSIFAGIPTTFTFGGTSP